jgi:hypothetical protein
MGPRQSKDELQVKQKSRVTISLIAKGGRLQVKQRSRITGSSIVKGARVWSFTYEIKVLTLE